MRVKPSGITTRSMMAAGGGFDSASMAAA